LKIQRKKSRRCLTGSLKGLHENGGWSLSSTSAVFQEGCAGIFWRAEATSQPVSFLKSEKIPAMLYVGKGPVTHSGPLSLFFLSFPAPFVGCFVSCSLLGFHQY
jgi:hypothetical protein